MTGKAKREIKKGGDTALLVSVIIESHNYGVFLDGAPLRRPVRPVRLIAAHWEELPDVHSTVVGLRMIHNHTFRTTEHL